MRMKRKKVSDKTEKNQQTNKQTNNQQKEETDGGAKAQY